MTKAYLEVDDVKRLERAATCLRDRLLTRVLFHLGCRVSEALNLEVKSVDFSEGTLTIEHLKARIRLSCPQCRASNSLVTLTAQTQEPRQRGGVTPVFLSFWGVFLPRAWEGIPPFLCVAGRGSYDLLHA